MIEQNNTLGRIIQEHDSLLQKKQKYTDPEIKRKCAQTLGILAEEAYTLTEAYPAFRVHIGSHALQSYHEAGEPFSVVRFGLKFLDETPPNFTTAIGAANTLVKRALGTYVFYS